MKKIVSIALALVLALSMCACGSNDTPADTTGTPQTSNKTPSTTPKGYLFTYNGVAFGVDMAADGVIEMLGTPKDQYTSESCAFGGKDTVYYYDGIQISANDEDGYLRIYSIYLESDLVDTQEGVCIGNTAEQVTAAYGQPATSTETVMTYEKDGMTLSFNLKDGVVSSILYNDPA